MFRLAADGTLHFHPAVDLAEATISAVQRRIRSRVLRLAVRHGGGFSLHAAVLIEVADRPGLERLLRYCARPAFASERLRWDGSDQPVRYSLTRPLPTGQTELARDPLELLDRLAALIPWPRRHRHHYAGVFAPHAKLRARAPPELETEGIDTAAFAFDQSPSWHSTAAASEPSFHFDQTLH